MTRCVRPSHRADRSVHLGMSYQYYILLYTTIYDYCTDTKSTSTSFQAKGGASLQGADLYSKLNTFLGEHCNNMREEGERLSDIELIKYYARQWDRYTTGAAYVHKLFNYLNKHWVKREKDEGRKDIYSVYTVGFGGLCSNPSSLLLPGSATSSDTSKSRTLSHRG